VTSFYDPQIKAINARDLLFFFPRSAGASRVGISQQRLQWIGRRRYLMLTRRHGFHAQGKVLPGVFARWWRLFFRGPIQTLGRRV